MAASLKLLFSLVVLTSVVSIHASSSSSFEDHVINVLQSNKVNLSLYYETLCPSCERFILNELAAALFDPDKNLISIVNLRLVPYGNAQVRAPNKTIVCQHGQDECYFNSIEACAIRLWPDVTQHFKFVRCLEQKLIQRTRLKEHAWASCCETLKMNPDRLGKCYNSGFEKKLILENAKETDQLVPPHEYVPWVVVNEQPLKDDYMNFASYVCNAYKGGPKPKACTSLLHNINSGGNSTLEGCYRGGHGGKSSISV